MAWEAGIEPPVPPTPRTQPINGHHPSPTGSDVAISYVGRNSLSVKGTYSGRLYRFSPSQPVQQVDARDGRVLLRTRYFRRA